MRTLVVVAVSCLLLVGVALAVGTGSGPGNPASSTVGLTSQTPARLAGVVARDVYGAHDATPRGVPFGYSWREGADTDPGTASTGFRDYRALNVWGQVFATESTTSYDARLEVRAPRVWWFTGGAWVEASLVADRVGGGYYAGDFRSEPVAGTARADAPGTWSMPLSGLDGSPDVLHFWWEGDFPRTQIPEGTRGILVRQEMRLTGDTAGAGVIGSTGADLFATPRTIVDPRGWNPGIPNARMKWVTATWQTFYATTLDLPTLQANPPPLEDS